MTHATTEFDPADWYWRVAGQDGVYSSRKRDYVSEEDDAYLNWLNDPLHRPTDIGSEALLVDVLKRVYPPGRPVNLPEFAAETRWELETGGIEIGGMPMRTDRESQALIHGAYSLAQVNEAASFRFKTSTGFVSLTAAQMLEIGEAVAAHIQACFAWEADILDDISAGQLSSEAAISARANAFMAV